MQAWDSPEVPRLPGKGLPLRLHDTATEEVRPTAPGATARMYVCGITPYDATHLGHAMTYVVFDVVQRAWRDAGHEVVYVQNVTDVDDPLLERAVATGDDWQALAERETSVFRQDMAALRVIAPQHYLGAVESVPMICERIAELQQRGVTYFVDGDLYLDLTFDEAFGSVSGLDRHTMAALAAQRGGDPERRGKRGPLDPLLWQAARPDEPAWDTRLGHGRPGWHVECVAIALAHLGMGFDLQGGGRDLVFPHHEMCAATARLVTGEPVFARHYSHVGMVGLHGEKMSKSRGNLVFVRDLRREVDPAAIRLALLARHYRDDWDWTGDDLDRAKDRLRVWRAGLQAAAGPSAERVLVRLRERISDDLDTPAALRAIDEWALAAAAGQGSDPAAPAHVRAAADSLLGVRVP